MFAAMQPSGPAAQSLRTRSGFSLPHLSVVGPVHGGSLFVTGAHLQLVAVEGANCPGAGHSHSSKSLSHASTSAARPNKSLKRNGDQATFRDFCEKHYSLETHGSHVSRWFNEDTKAPMDMPVEFVAAFESFTGWHGLTQFFNRKAKTTCLEEMQHRLAA